MGEQRATPSAAGAERAEELRAEIEAAFGARAHPGAAALEPPPGRGDGEPWAPLRGLTWRELARTGMTAEQRDFVHALTPAGWLYYFPALAALALDPDHPAEVDDTLLVKLAWRPREIDDGATPAERRALVHFLDYLADLYDERGWENLARYALDQHWSSSRDGSPRGDSPGRGDDLAAEAAGEP